MKKKIVLAFLFLIGKFAEYAPFFIEEIVYAVFFAPLFYLLIFLKVPHADLEIYAFVLNQIIQSLFRYAFPFIFLFALINPLVLGLLTKNKKTVELYWLFSTLVDLCLLFISVLWVSASPTIENASGLWLVFLLATGLLISRSIGLLLTMFILRRRQTKK